MHPAGSVAAARSEVADPRVHRWLNESWANEGEQGVQFRARILSALSPVPGIGLGRSVSRHSRPRQGDTDATKGLPMIPEKPPRNT